MLLNETSRFLPRAQTLADEKAPHWRGLFLEKKSCFKFLFLGGLKMTIKDKLFFILASYL